MNFPIYINKIIPSVFYRGDNALYVIFSVLQCRYADFFLELPHEVIFIIVSAVQSDLLYLEIRMPEKLHCLVHTCGNDIILDACGEKISVQSLKMASAYSEIL